MERNSLSCGMRWMPPFLFLVSFVIATWPTWLTLANRWLKFDQSYSHGFLILAVCLFLSVATWKRERPPAGFFWFWCVPLIGAGLVYAAGSVLMVGAFEQLALVPLLISGLLVMWGWRQAAPFFVPIGLMVFALPLWDYLSWPLQLITVAFNQFLLSWFDIEFIVEGIFVYFPGIGAFEVANGCSGLRYLLVGMTLAVIYGELNYQKLRSRILLFVVAVILALVANWIRVFIIIYMGYETNMTSSLIDDHDMFGWWVFAGTLVPVFYIARQIELREIRADQHERSDSDETVNALVSGNAPLFGIFAVILPMLAVGSVSWLTMHPKINLEEPESQQHAVALVDPSRWLPLFQNTLSGWKPAMENPDQILERAFLNREGLDGDRGSTEQIMTALYTYDYQRPGAELVYYLNRLYDSSMQILERTFTIETGEGPTMSGLTLRFRRSDEVIHLAYGYYVEGRWETNELEAKLAQLPGLLNGRTDASLFVIGFQCADCDAEQRLRLLAPDIRARAIKYVDSLYKE